MPVPVPPHSSSKRSPKSSCSRKSSTTSHGNSWLSSISAARGAIRSRASVRTSSRISRCSSVSTSHGTRLSLVRRVYEYPRRDPRERRRPDDGRRRCPTARRARDRRRPRRRRRRHARDGARHARTSSTSAAAACMPGHHRLARPLPHLGDGAAAGPARGARPRPRTPPSGCARRRRGRSPAAGSARRASARRTGRRRRRRRCSTRSPATSPAALISKDYHAIWLNSAAIARTGGDLRTLRGPRAASSSSTPTASRPALLREESAWHFKEDHLEYSDEEYLDALREGLKVASSRGVTAIHDKDGWIPAIPRLWQELEREDALPAARLAVDPARAARRRRRSSASRSGLGSDRLRLGYLKVVHGRHARLADGADDRRDRRRDHERARSSPTSSAGRPRARLAGRGPRDRRPREPERARRVRGDARRVAAARAAPPHRAHAVPARRRTSAASPSSG